MNKYRFFKQGVLLIGMISMLSTLVYADKIRDRDDRDRYDRDRSEQYKHNDRNRYDERNRYVQRDRRSDEKPPKGYRMDNRYGHDRYYPRPGYDVIKLPPKSYNIRYRDSRYYFHGGIWYRPIGTRFVVIAPPIGIVVPFLPAFYTTIWFGGIPYYYANDVYYVWDAGRNGYVVTNPPPQINEEQPPLVADELYIYPKQGQSEQQQANDRYACHDWGVKQTGYDPTRPPGNVSQAELNMKREDYQRAMKACLEGRGYSVR